MIDLLTPSASQLIVYGIQASNNRIIQVSPGVKPLQQKITTSRSGLAGCGDGKNLGWLYYVRYTLENLDSCCYVHQFPWLTYGPGTPHAMIVPPRYRQ